MAPILYDSIDLDLMTHMGIGKLTDAIKVNVVRGINTVYELTMVYPISGQYYKELREGRWLFEEPADDEDPEPFRIMKISRPFNGRVTVLAFHISYLLRGYVVKPYTATSKNGAISGIQQNLLNTGEVYNFSMSAEEDEAKPFSLTVPAPVRSVMGGTEGSILDTYGGEWQFKGWNCVLKNRIGQDTDVEIRYGVNMTNASKVTDMSNFWDGVVPYWVNPDTNVATYYNGVIKSSFTPFEHPSTIAVDCSADFESEPTQAQLKSWGESYVETNARTSVPTTIKVSFQPLWQTEEYKNIAPLERLHLGDSVTVKYADLGIDNKARIIETDYDGLAKKYESMTIGSVRANFAQKIENTVKEQTANLPTKSFLQAAIDAATALLNGEHAGSRMLTITDADGTPQGIIIMDTNDPATARNCIRINNSGIGFSNNGPNGPYPSAWTIDNKLYMDRIDVQNLSADYIKTGTLDGNDVNITNLKAGNINSGTLTSLAINNGNGTFSVDANGNLVAKSADIQGGRINIVSSTDENAQLIKLQASAVGTSFSGTFTPSNLRIMSDSTTSYYESGCGLGGVSHHYKNKSTGDEYVSSMSTGQLHLWQNGRNTVSLGSMGRLILNDASENLIEMYDSSTNARALGIITNQYYAWLVMRHPGTQTQGISISAYPNYSQIKQQYKGADRFSVTAYQNYTDLRFMYGSQENIVMQGNQTSGFINLYYAGKFRAQLDYQGLRFYDANGNLTKSYPNT